MRTLTRATIALLALSTFGAAVAIADQDEADTCVRSKVWEAYPEGWAVRTITKSSLAETEHRIYLLTLYAGNEYKFLGCGDNALTNVDLVLYDADGRMLVQDQTEDRQPEVSFRPTTTDTFYLAVHAAKLVEGTQAGHKASVSTAVTYR
ncbi:MAG: hypothetical protein ABIO70_21900 [Pseudomonadota bacterium]